MVCRAELLMKTIFCNPSLRGDHSRHGSPLSSGVVSISNGSPRFARDDNNLFEFRHCEEANCRRGIPDSYVDVSMSNGSPRFARDDGGTEGR